MEASRNQPLTDLIITISIIIIIIIVNIVSSCAGARFPPPQSGGWAATREDDVDGGRVDGWEAPFVYSKFACLGGSRLGEVLGFRGAWGVAFFF